MGSSLAEWPHRRQICMTGKPTKASSAGIIAHDTSCQLECVYGPGQLALLAQEIGDSGPCHVGKLERKY